MDMHLVANTVGRASTWHSDPSLVQLDESYEVDETGRAWERTHTLLESAVVSLQEARRRKELSRHQR